MGACEVLGDIGETAATKEVIVSLIKVLSDENPDVHKGACKALATIAIKTASDVVIVSLADTL